jgi:two-component system chemotaxis sensor kinase CheA
VTKLQDHLDQIIVEVDNIKSGSVHEFTSDFATSSDEDEIQPAQPIRIKEEVKTSVDVSAEIAETQIKKHIEEKIQQVTPEEPERTKTSAEKIQESIAAGTPPIEIEEIAPKTLRVDIDRINDLLNMTSEMVLNRAVFTQLSLDYSRFYDYLFDNKKLSRSELQTLRNLISSFELNVESLGRATNLLQDGVMKIRLVPINLLFRKIPRIVRDLSIKTGKKVRIEFKGEETELDRTVIEKISDPIIHILRNAVDHGIELPEIRKKLGKSPIGTVTCSSYYEGDIVVVEISDDGVGIDVDKIKERVKELKILDERDLEKFTDSDLLELIFFPGFSTSKSVTDTSGRGVGMDVVRDNISKLGGTVTISSDKDKGTTITMRIPLTLAIIKTLLVKISALVYAIPVASISETIKINTNEINFVEDEEVINFRDKVIPLIRLDNIFTFPETTPFPESDATNIENSEFLSHLDRPTEQTQLGDSSSLAENEIYIVVLQVGEKEFGLHVNALIGEQDIVIENLDDTLVHSQGISGAAILGDGTIALTMDVIELTKLSVEREQAKSKLAKHVLIDQIRQETGLNTRENGK